jgi:hypothetical protein
LILLENTVVRCEIDVVEAGRPVAITFGHWFPAGAERYAFARRTIAAEGLNAIHLIARGNDWYTRDPASYDAAFAAVRDLPLYANAPHRFAFGSSMGAHAAIRFRDRFDLDAVIASCPQFAIDPDKAPFETRWREDLQSCDFAEDVLAPITIGEPVYLLYDPSHRADRAHVEAIDPDRHAHRIALPFFGHPPTETLAKIDALEPLLHAIFTGEDVRPAVHAAMNRRREAPEFWHRLGSHWATKEPLGAFREKALWAIGEGLERDPRNAALLNARWHIQQS